MTCQLHTYDLDDSSNQNKIHCPILIVILFTLFVFTFFMILELQLDYTWNKTTNIMYFSWCNHLPISVKSALKPLSFDKLELANGSSITMLGTTRGNCMWPGSISTCMLFFMYWSNISASYSGNSFLGEVWYFT